jgi:uncharacterized phage protein (TIGR02220 family)
MAEEYFTQIWNELIRSKKLTPNEKAVLNVILSYNSLDKIYLKQQTIADEANMHRDTAHRTIKSLKDKGFISTKGTPDRATLLYKLLTKVVTAKNDKGYCLNRQGVTAETDSSNKELSNIKLEIGKPKKISPEDKIPYKQILDYLNEKAKRNYSPVNGHKKFIKARWNEGARLVDYKTVIDNKCKEWKDTEWDKYLQPSTLFGNKFDQYLNQPEVKKDEPTIPRREI